MHEITLTASRQYPNNYIDLTCWVELEGSDYSFQRYHPVTGEWKDSVLIKADDNGVLCVPDFPDGKNRVLNDWVAKIIEK